MVWCWCIVCVLCVVGVGVGVGVGVFYVVLCCVVWVGGCVLCVCCVFKKMEWRWSWWGSTQPKTACTPDL